jgi:CDP-diacylglycerol--inositol 3-phosphatidyltransferase
MSIGRRRWTGRTRPGTDIEIWCSVGHGHGSVRSLAMTRPPAVVLSYTRTSRCTTSCLLCYLSSAYPNFALVFQFLIALDFSSHYMHMYRCVLSLLSLVVGSSSRLDHSSLVTGSRSHKLVTSEVSRILWYYYNDSVSLSYSHLSLD